MFCIFQCYCFHDSFGEARDFDGYYILRTAEGFTPSRYNGSGDPLPPFYAVGKWTNSNSGTCPGITFPQTLPRASGTPDPTQPNSNNEIMINPTAVAFPYNCFTTYVANIYSYPSPSLSDTPTLVGQDKCIVGVRLKVVEGSVERVHLIASSVSGSGQFVPKCTHTVSMPFINFKGIE